MMVKTRMQMVGNVMRNVLKGGVTLKTLEVAGEILQTLAKAEQEDREKAGCIGVGFVVMPNEFEEVTNG